MHIAEWLSFVKLTPTSWPRVVAIVKKRDKCICQYCGRFDEKGEVDHVLPLSRGGTDAFTNLVWACRPCNRSKGDKTVREWVRYLAQRDREDIFAGIAGLIDMMHEQDWFPGTVEEEYARAIVQLEAAAGGIATLLKSLEMKGFPKQVILEYESRYLSLTGIMGSGESLIGSDVADEACEREIYVSELLAERAAREREAGHPSLLGEGPYRSGVNGNRNGHGNNGDERSLPLRQGRLL